MTKVLINGCFDGLHAGHKRLIDEAQKLGEHLVIGMNSGPSIRELKGEDRPHVPCLARYMALKDYAARRLVGTLHIFGFDTEDDLRDLIIKERPDIMLKSSEYINRHITGKKELLDAGGKIVFLDRLEGVSTTLNTMENEMPEALITEKELKQRLSNRPAPTVTKEKIDARISDAMFRRGLDMGAPTLTICTIILDNGYTVRGESACVNPENYDRQIGEKLAYDDAYKKLWPLFGFLLAEEQYHHIEINREEGIDFGDAICALKSGYRVSRTGWNGKAMWLSFSPGSNALEAERFWSPHNKAHAVANGGTADVLPCITMKTADGKILMGWLASQSDMLANDWVILPNNK